MFNKIKSVLITVSGTIIAFMAMILGIRKKKIKKLEKEAEIKDTVIRENEISKEVEQAHSEKVIEVKDDISKTIEAVRKDEKSYNDIIDAWNNRS